MPALRILCAPVLIALIALVMACGDDSGPSTGGTGTPGVIVGTPRLNTPAGPTPGDEKSPPPEESATPATRTDGAAEPPPTASQGTAAVAPADQEQFVSSFAGRSLTEESCSYDPSTRITNCPGRGLFAVDPPLAGQDVSCALVVEGSNAVAIRCSSQEPQQTLYYEITQRLN